MSQKHPPRANEREWANVQRLRALAALALTETAAAGPCPQPEAIAAWHDDVLDGDEAAGVVRHLASCERCFRLVAGLLQVEEETMEQVAERAEHADQGRGAQSARRPSGRWRFAGAAVSLAMAGIVAFGLLQSGAGRDPLPRYELSLAGRTLMRGTQNVAADESLHFAAGNEFVLLLRPESAVDDQVSVRAFVQANGRNTPLAMPAPEITTKGIVRIAGEVGRDLALPAGRSMLLIAVGRPAALPDAAGLAARLATQGAVRTDGWAGWRVAIEVKE